MLAYGQIILADKVPAQYTIIWYIITNKKSPLKCARVPKS